MAQNDDAREKTQRGDTPPFTLPFDDTAKVTSDEKAALEALAKSEGEDLPSVATVEKNADGFFVVKIKGESDGAYYSDEATARRVARALTPPAATKTETKTETSK